MRQMTQAKKPVSQRRLASRHCSCGLIRRAFQIKKVFLLLCGLIVLGGCRSPAPARTPGPTQDAPASPTPACPITTPELVTPPQDPAIPEPPAPGYYFAGDNGEILVSAWWWSEPGPDWIAGDPSNKVGLFRPAGAPLEFSGRRLDGASDPLNVELAALYPERFQASSWRFPSPGCWEIGVRAGGSALTFTARVGEGQR